MDEFQKQALTEHLAELRSCLIVSLIAVGVCFAAAYGVIEEIGEWFFKPLFDVLPDQSSLIFTSYQEAFFFYLKLALTCGVLLASPVIFLQIWRFVAPGLYRHEKRVLLPFAILSAFCFLGGAAFGYLVVFPPAFKFLMGYSNDFLSPMPTVKEYFSLSLRLLIAFGAIFELPIFMVLLAKLGIVNATFLRQHRKYAFLLSFVIAAILTPTPDVVNQCMMAGPLVVLYEVSIVAVWLLGRKIVAGGGEVSKGDAQ
ncbi:MAG: twin-arginine translocase subunit TatC [Desulfobulbaceae bacterium]|nr:twin-arginine translocase subunit TatC [Desulfobulbaceae bacterium]